MIYATTLVFPIIAIVAGITVVGALIKFVLEIYSDIRGSRAP